MALAVTGEKRAGSAPELPTMAESGLPGYAVTSWFGLLAPVATPAEIIARLNTETNTAVHAIDMKDRLAGEGADPMAGTAVLTISVMHDSIVGLIAKPQ